MANAASSGHEGGHRPRHSYTAKDLAPGSLHKIGVAAVSHGGVESLTAEICLLTKPSVDQLQPRRHDNSSPYSGTRPDSRKRVYHYTRTSGLAGILKSSTLRATLLHYMNDNREYLYVYRQAVEYLRRIPDIKKHAEESPELALAIQEDLPRVKETVPTGKDAHRFVISFTEAEDDLSQWRAYGGIGEGYTLGFSATGLYDLARAMPGWSFVKCGYGEGAQHSNVVSALKRAFASYKASGRKDAEAAVEALQNALAVYAPIVKHEAFVAEREWRLISPPLSVFRDEDGVEYREGSTTLIPYVAVKLPLNGPEDAPGRLAGVSVGPGPNPDLALHSVLGLLATRGIYVGVSLTRAPYRSL